uniref:Uncharacterized protein n=1 Tax=Rhodosorus marinus TaxID=101924 RepID=A0A7S0BPC4_9RHOD
MLSANRRSPCTLTPSVLRDQVLKARKLIMCTDTKPVLKAECQTDSQKVQKPLAAVPSPSRFISICPARIIFTRKFVPSLLQDIPNSQNLLARVFQLSRLLLVGASSIYKNEEVSTTYRCL